MEGMKIYKRPKLKDPYLIVAWPGMGEVAFRTVTYLIEKLKAVECAEVSSREFFYFTESVIQKGIINIQQLPYTKLYYWKNKQASNDLLFLLSDAQPDLAKSEDYCIKLISLAKSFGVKTVISFAAMPQTIDYNQAPNVWFTATSEELIKSLKKYNMQLLSEGQISGLNGLFLGIAKAYGLEGFCLLGEVPLYAIQIENPRASHAVLEIVCKMLNIHIDFSGLIEQAHAIDAQINNLLSHFKLGLAPGPIEEDEVESIKKALSQLTKLPASVKEKIEKLFALAKTNITHANELKNELDKWNVYKEYEDRFLDLFKKKIEPKNN